MKIDILGVQINADTKNTVISLIIKKMLGEREKIFMVTPYSEMIVRAQKDEGFRNILNAATFALPDGIGVLWAAHFLEHTTHNTEHVPSSMFHVLWKLITSLASVIMSPKSIHDPIPEKISGSDFIWDLAGLAADRGLSIFLLGGYGETPDLVAAKLKSKFSNLKIAGTHAPPYLANSSPLMGEDKGGGDVVEKINSASTDFLFVALGPVAQEKWIAENLPKLNVKLAIGLGGTFDYLAGKRVPAPQIWRNLGLEWLWRLMTQPWRALRISRGVLGLIYHSIKTNRV